MIYCIWSTCWEDRKGIKNIFSAFAAHCFGTVGVLPRLPSLPAGTRNAGTNIAINSLYCDIIKNKKS